VNVTIPDFWRLLGESRLLTAAQVQRLGNDFGQEKHATPPTSRTVAQWLMDHRAISKYQATVLLAGRAGPFFYGDYKVYERVEKGRLAGRFRAAHIATKHPVLLRFLTGPVLTDPRLWDVASANTRAAAQITSPYVQRHFEAVDLQKFKFVVSEDVRGTALDEKIAGGRLPPAEACRVVRLAALGLAQMHGQGRVHGDVRLGSVVLESAPNEPNVKLLFDAHLTPGPIDISQQQAGSPLEVMADYLAPELLTPGQRPEAVADIYALGCTLYVLLTGSPPFAGGTVKQKLARHVSEPIRPLETYGVAPPLAQLVTHLMAKNPAVRYQSAALVAEQLATFVEPAALRIAPPGPPPTLAAYEQRKGSGVGGQETEIGKVQAPPSFPTGSGVSMPAAAALPAFGIAVAKGRTGGSAAEILRRRKVQQKKNQFMVLGLGGFILVLALGGLGIWWSAQGPSRQTVASAGGGDSTAAAKPTDSKLVPKGKGPAAQADPGGSGEGVGNSPAGSSEESGSAAGKSSGAAAGVPTQLLVPDDGKTLWASPTAGKPVSFRCVPPEGEVFIILRPAAMLASEEGKRVIAALGPALDAERKAWEAANGFNLEEIEQLHITLHNNDARFPRTSFVVKTKESVGTEQLLAKWGNPSMAKEGAETYYTGPQWAYYIAHSPEDERTFAMGEARDIKDVAAAAGGPPAVFREIERLRRTTDAERHFALLFYPHFLFNDDAEPLFAGDWTKVRPPLEWLLGDQVQAACVSGHFGDTLYFELRMRASLDKEPYALARELRERLDVIPTAVEDYFVTLNPPTYWRKLASRYPLMVRELRNQVRSGVENEMVVVNSVLPVTAAHNLVLGGELLVSTAPGQAAATGAVVVSSGPKTIADALQLKTSYSFDQQSLEFAMRDLAEDVKGNLKGAQFEFAIKIIGDDLKIDGITRNQSIRDFRQENQTVADILTALVRKANPVKTEELSETDQKLVWVIGPDPDSPANQIVLITTRNAATKKKYTLPGQFVAKKK